MVLCAEDIGELKQIHYLLQQMLVQTNKLKDLLTFRSYANKQT